MEVRVEVDASLRKTWETCSIYPGSCPRWPSKFCCRIHTLDQWKSNFFHKSIQYYHVLPCITMYYHVWSIFFTSQSFILVSSFEVTSPSSWLARHDYLFFTWIGVGGRICDQLRRLPGYSVRSGRWKGGTRLAAMVNPCYSHQPLAAIYFRGCYTGLPWLETIPKIFSMIPKFLTRYPSLSLLS